MNLTSVLVVDDDPAVFALLAKEGSARGFEMVGAVSNEQAVDALAARRFAVAVVNLHVGAASGLDIVRKVRETDSYTEAIVISADRRL